MCAGSPANGRLILSGHRRVAIPYLGVGRTYTEADIHPNSVSDAPGSRAGLLLRNAGRGTSQCLASCLGWIVDTMALVRKPLWWRRGLSVCSFWNHDLGGVTKRHASFDGSLLSRQVIWNVTYFLVTFEHRQCCCHSAAGLAHDLFLDLDLSAGSPRGIAGNAL